MKKMTYRQWKKNLDEGRYRWFRDIPEHLLQGPLPDFLYRHWAMNLVVWDPEDAATVCNWLGDKVEP